MQRVDAKTKHLERAGRLGGGSNTAVDAFKAALKLGNSTIQAPLALGCLRAADLRVAQAPRRLGVLAAQAVKLIVTLGKLGSNLAHTSTGLVTRARQLVHLGLSRPNLLCGLLATARELRLVCQRRRQRLLESTDLGKDRSPFTFKAGDLACDVAFRGTRMHQCRASLIDLLACMLKGGGEVGLKTRELTDAALTLKRALGGVGARAQAHHAAVAHARAIRRHVQDARDRGRSERLLQAADKLDVAKKRGNDGAEALAHLQALDQALAGSA